MRRTSGLRRSHHLRRWRDSWEPGAASISGDSGASRPPHRSQALVALLVASQWPTCSTKAAPTSMGLQHRHHARWRACSTSAMPTSAACNTAAELDGGLAAPAAGLCSLGDGGLQHRHPAFEAPAAVLCSSVDGGCSTGDRPLQLRRLTFAAPANRGCSTKDRPLQCWCRGL